MVKEKGFSLLELLMVIAIVGVLVAVSYPSYKDSVVRSRRTDAKIALLDAAKRVEIFYSENNTYAGVNKFLNFPHDSVQGFYSIDLIMPNPATARGFILKATAQKGQKLDDKKCSIFTYNDLGEEGIDGATSSSNRDLVNRCWLR